MTFFIDGPGGTGKTFLYKAILATVRSQNKIALATQVQELRHQSCQMVEQHTQDLKYQLLAIKSSLSM